VSEADLAIMRRLDRLHLEFPFAGSRMLQGLLLSEGCKIGRRHVRRVMRRMGIAALYRRPRTTKPEPGHKIYPYLLGRDYAAKPGMGDGHHLHPDGARGFVYLAVVLDWFSRRVLSWRVSVTIEAAFCVETLEEALARHGRPDIFNTDQGSQNGGSSSPFSAALRRGRSRRGRSSRCRWSASSTVRRRSRAVLMRSVRV
jgi:putative transposase